MRLFRLACTCFCIAVLAQGIRTPLAVAQTDPCADPEIRPRVDVVYATTSNTEVHVRFNYEIDPASSENTSNYSITPGVGILSAQLLNDQHTVLLTVSGVTTGQEYTLRASNIKDRCTPEPDVISPQTEVDFYALPANRVEAGLIALYMFTSQQTSVVYDISRFGSPLDLIVEDPDAVAKSTGQGLSILSSTIIASEEPPTKLYNQLMASNEITVEAWIEPSDLSQSGPSRIVTLSKDSQLRNWTLAQDNDEVVFRLRTTERDDNGQPAVDTSGDVLSPGRNHVVYKRDSAGVASIFVNGQLAVAEDVMGNFSNWDRSYLFGLANELEADRTWRGNLGLVAIYNRALTSQEITQNYNAGVRLVVPVTRGPVSVAILLGAMSLAVAGGLVGMLRIRSTRAHVAN